MDALPDVYNFSDIWRVRMVIGLASDHAGFEAKERIKSILNEKSISYTDFGCFQANQSVDYPDYIKLAAQAVAEKTVDTAIICCGSGIGASIVANKIHTIRAALCHNPETVRLARQHNDANVLAIGGRTTSHELYEPMVQAFLETPFEQGRHVRRIQKIHELEK